MAEANEYGNRAAILKALDKTLNLDGLSGLLVHAIMSGRVSDTVVKGARLDSATEALITMSYAHHEIHAGSHFFTGSHLELGNGATHDILFVTPDNAKLSHMTFTLSTAIGAVFTYYEEVVATGNGTPLIVVDRNRNTKNVAGTTFFHSPTGLSNLTEIIGDGAIGAGRTAGGTIRDSNEFVLVPNTKYLIRLTNTETTANEFDWFFDWYEHEDRN
jgi:hypothetical protein